MLIVATAVSGTLYLLVEIFALILVFAVLRNRSIQAGTAAALPGFTAHDSAGTCWYVGDVAGRPVAVGSVVVQVNKRIGRHGRRVQRRTRLVTPLATLEGGTLYCPAGSTEPSVEEGRARARRLHPRCVAPAQPGLQCHRTARLGHLPRHGRPQVGHRVPANGDDLTFHPLLHLGTALQTTANAREGTLEVDRTTGWHALLIGIAQGIAILPAISLSGMTIVTSILLGLRRDLAGRFSFVIRVTAILGPVLLKAHTAQMDPAVVSAPALIEGVGSRRPRSLMALRTRPWGGVFHLDPLLA